MRLIQYIEAFAGCIDVVGITLLYDEITRSQNLQNGIAVEWYNITRTVRLTSKITVGRVDDMITKGCPQPVFFARKSCSKSSLVRRVPRPPLAPLHLPS